MLSYFTHSKKGKEPEKQAPLKPAEKEEAEEEADRSPVLSPQDERFLEHVVAEEGNDLLTFYNLFMVFLLQCAFCLRLGVCNSNPASKRARARVTFKGAIRHEERFGEGKQPLVLRSTFWQEGMTMVMMMVKSITILSATKGRLITESVAGRRRTDQNPMTMHLLRRQRKVSQKAPELRISVREVGKILMS
jgi:hypothetical protein